jgi:hypothetical protein
LFENFRENSLKQDLSNDTTVNPPHFSLVNTFKTNSNPQYWQKQLRFSYSYLILVMFGFLILIIY